MAARVDLELWVVEELGVSKHGRDVMDAAAAAEEEQEEEQEEEGG